MGGNQSISRSLSLRLIKNISSGENWNFFKSIYLHWVILWCFLTLDPFFSFKHLTCVASRPPLQLSVLFQAPLWGIISDSVFRVNVLIPCFLFMVCNFIKAFLNFLKFASQLPFFFPALKTKTKNYYIEIQPHSTYIWENPMS